MWHFKGEKTIRQAYMVGEVSIASRYTSPHGWSEFVKACTTKPEKKHPWTQDKKRILQEVEE